MLQYLSGKAFHEERMGTSWEVKETFDYSGASELVTAVSDVEFAVGDLIRNKSI